jgi:hypothetical protein
MGISGFGGSFFAEDTVRKLDIANIVLHTLFSRMDIMRIALQLRQKHCLFSLAALLAEPVAKGEESNLRNVNSGSCKRMINVQYCSPFLNTRIFWRQESDNQHGDTKSVVSICTQLKNVFAEDLRAITRRIHECEVNKAMNQILTPTLMGAQRMP